MKSRRKMPQINASSMADIAFLLLIFFLIVSSFDSMTGIYRKMNPAQAEHALKQKQDIESRNLLSLVLNENNEIIYDYDQLSLVEMKELAKVFIANPNNLEFLPEKEEIELAGGIRFLASKKHHISLEISSEANYQSYLSVLNELTAAYNELRNEAAQTIYGKPFDKLSSEQQEALLAVYPSHISENVIDHKTLPSDAM